MLPSVNSTLCPSCSPIRPAAPLSLLAGFMRDGRLRRSEQLLSTAVVMAAVLGVATTCILEVRIGRPSEVLGL